MHEDINNKNDRIMLENSIIPQMQSDFERIKKMTEDGQEYMTSRELYAIYLIFFLESWRT